jgi:hypothetical protein
VRCRFRNSRLAPRRSTSAAALRISPRRVCSARQRLAPVGKRRVAGLQQRLLGGQQVGPVLGRNQGQLPSRGFRLQARHLDLAQLQPAADFAALAAGDLVVEADEQLTGRDRLALANMDGGDPAAMRMIDDLDPAGGLHHADGLDHLIDLGPGNPAQQRQEQGGDAADQRPCERRRAVVQQHAGEFGLTIRFSREFARHGLSPSPEGRPAAATRPGCRPA